jgi:hypothetical protein
VYSLLGGNSTTLADSGLWLCIKHTAPETEAQDQLGFSSDVSALVASVLP